MRPPRVGRQPDDVFLTALRAALIENGIDVRGPVVDIDDLQDAPARNSGPALVIHRSASLGTLAVTLMKESQNLYAETFLKTMGDTRGVGTSEHGQTVTTEVLHQWGTAGGELIQMDGSGLSRYDYVTAAMLMGILSHARHDDVLRGTLEASPPIAGRDGTLAGRMKATAAEGNARAKTGSMSNVWTLAGYIATADGSSSPFRFSPTTSRRRQTSSPGRSTRWWCVWPSYGASLTSKNLHEPERF